jgi:hypothetical protein
LNFEGQYEITHQVNVRLADSLELQHISVKYLGNQNFFPTVMHSSEYDPFNHILLASDYVNYNAAIRAQHSGHAPGNGYPSGPKEFGMKQVWFVFTEELIDGNYSIVRYKVCGFLSALRQKFPDAVTMTILRDAGVDIRNLNIPRMIMRL